jgi:hypothetical protein
MVKEVLRDQAHDRNADSIVRERSDTIVPMEQRGAKTTLENPFVDFGLLRIAELQNMLIF